jgi:hypothetical protein
MKDAGFIDIYKKKHSVSELTSRYLLLRTVLLEYNKFKYIR